MSPKRHTRSISVFLPAGEMEPRVNLWTGNFHDGGNPNFHSLELTPTSWERLINSKFPPIKSFEINLTRNGVYLEWTFRRKDE